MNCQKLREVLRAGKGQVAVHDEEHVCFAGNSGIGTGCHGRVQALACLCDGVGTGGCRKGCHLRFARYHENAVDFGGVGQGFKHIFEHRSCEPSALISVKRVGQAALREIEALDRNDGPDRPPVTHDRA